jgi:hypothetical protein
LQGLSAPNRLGLNRNVLRDSCYLASFGRVLIEHLDALTSEIIETSLASDSSELERTEALLP